jgi:hypothetical protein
MLANLSEKFLLIAGDVPSECTINVLSQPGNNRATATHFVRFRRAVSLLACVAWHCTDPDAFAAFRIPCKTRLLCQIR